MKASVNLLLRFCLPLLLLLACDKEGTKNESPRNISLGTHLTHEKIVLGKRLENPYKTINVKSALESLYPTKAGRVDIITTNLYVRFLPINDAQLTMLQDKGLTLIDHPLDYQILVEGDYYHDPSVEEGKITWQYAVVPHDFIFPDDVSYELIDECYIPDFSPNAKSEDGIDWEAVEREAYRLTGNESMLEPLTKAEKQNPSGRITIVDKNANGGKPVGLAGVRVCCNTFVRIAKTYTDRDGYYKFDKKFSSDLRYRIIYKNKLGFSIGFNAILVPASVSTLGKAPSEGLDFMITEESEAKLFRRSVVNNACYEYYSRCSEEDLNISQPPANLRIWVFPSLEASSAPMLHHGTILNEIQLNSYWSYCVKILHVFLPDITIGTQTCTTYQEIYSAVCHELAHASHYTKVGNDYWNSYIYYIVEAYIKNRNQLYGDGTGERAGYCAVGESWAYFLQSKMFKDRYGGTMPTFGTSFWFHPQVFRYLNDRGFSISDLFHVLREDVNSEEDLKNALISNHTSQKQIIEQAFTRYL